MRRLRLLLCLAVVVGLCPPAAAESKERNRPWQREPLRIALERLLSWNLGAEVGIDALEGPLVPEVVLRGVSVDVGGERLADIDSLRVRVDVWALFGDGTLFVELIELKNPILSLTRGADGGWNIPKRGDPEAREEDDESAFVTQLNVGEISVSGGVLGIRDEAKGLDLGFDLNARGESVSLPWGAPENLATSASMDVSLRPSEAFGESFQSGALKLSLAEGNLRVTELGTRGSFGTLHAEGDLDVSRSWSRPAGRLALSGSALRPRDIPLGDLELKIASPGEGIVRIELLDLEGQVPIRIARGSEVRIGSESAASQGVSFDDFAFSVGGQPVSVSGRIESSGPRELRVATAGFRADVLGTLLDSPVALGGLVDAGFTLDGDFPTPALTGRVEWADPRVSEVQIDRADATLKTQGDTLRVEVQAVDATR